jgi:hypothetical protein
MDRCKSQVQWLLPIIPATQEAEIKRIAFKANPGQKDPISTNKSWAQWQAPVIPTTWKAQQGSGYKCETLLE